MPVLRFSINQRTSKELAEAAKEKIAELVVERARKNFKNIKPQVADVVDEEIEKMSSDFIPNDDQIYELGVGELDESSGQGRILREKTDKAWEVLRIGSGRGITKITTRKGEGKTGIGNIQVHIDYEKFFTQDECIVSTPDSDKINQIPWMRWFIEGAEVSGYQFIETNKSKRSRTGGGIMVVKGLWRFAPQSHIINELQIRIANGVNAFIRGFVQEEILKR